MFPVQHARHRNQLQNPANHQRLESADQALAAAEMAAEELLQVR